MRRASRRSAPTPTVFKKILIANRGEIAVRVVRACHELHVPCVAVYSDADREAAHVGAADEAYRLGPAAPQASYLDVERLLHVAQTSGCDAVHPGYGFLAENAAFARACMQAGITFIGPSPESIERMGDKIAARAIAREAGFPVVPGTPAGVKTAQQAQDAGREFGDPIALKAAAGGGGKGLKVAHDPSEVDAAFSLASKEALAYFNDGTIYVERYLARPKHVEVQVLGDKHGNAVHVGERDCSLQRRHQKLVEETPACIAPHLRARLLDAAVRLVRSIGYDSAGTIECLVEGDRFYFLEMNTRIQVEHAISEAVWGIDLVKAQIRIAAGEALWFAQSDLSGRGHAIECRINAESPADDFRPSPGRLDAVELPAGPGVRVDGAAFPGWVIPREYDSLIAKIVTWGQDRAEAQARMLRALGECTISGVHTTIPFLRLLLASDAFVRGDYATPDVEHFVATHRAEIAGAARAREAALSFETGSPAAPSRLTVEIEGKRFAVDVYGQFGAPARARASASSPRPRHHTPKKVQSDEVAVVAPMHGIVAEIKVAAGDRVTDGQVVAVIEAMKMMNEVVSHREGMVRSVDASPGTTVETGAPIISFEPSTASE
jgi:acetyl-CoA/propionyl-CoA carboxylase, biotin carboxylase, biotin carboxyl carrier protein